MVQEITTMTHNRTWSMMLLLTTLALVLAACGGTAPTPASQPTAAPAAGAPTAAPAADAPTAAPAAEAPTAAPAAEPAAGGILNGVTLPADAAPADQQVYVVHYDNTADFTTIDFFESV